MATDLPNYGIDAHSLVNDAISRIYSDYGHVVSVRRKGKGLLKFGLNPNAGTSSATIWYTGQDEANETYVADNVNSIDTVSSNNAGDTEVITIEGHTMSGGNRTFAVQQATLNGQNKVTLTTPLNRCTRLYHSGLSSTDLVGEIYIYEDTSLTSGKPTDTSKIHLTVQAGKNQSEKASTSLSSTDYWIVTGMRGSILEKASTAYAEIQLQIRNVGGVFRDAEDIQASNSSSGVLTFVPYLIIPTNSDVRLVAVADSNGRAVTGSLQGYLAKIIG